MRYRQLGQTGLKVSEVGFGCWGIAGDSYGTTDDVISIDALHYSIEKGVTLFDTSDLYGHGKSESILGQAVNTKLRSEVFLASKVGAGISMEQQNFDPAYIHSCLIKSLERLQSTYLDLYQLHNPPVQDLPTCKAAFEKLRELKMLGLIRAIGLSVKSPEEAVLALDHFEVDSIQVNFNLLDQRAFSLGVFEKAGALGTGVIVRTPLCFGFLSGEYSNVAFEKNDHRSLWSLAQRKTWAEGIEKFISFKDSKESNAQFAIRFCLSFPEVSATIPGMLNRAHVDDNASASGLPLFNSNDLSAMHEHYKRFSFFLKNAN